MSEAAARAARWAPALVFAAAALVYLNALAGEFVYDDYPFIVQNESVHTLARPWKFLTERTAFSEGGGYTIFRPLAGLIFSILWVAAGATPALFHAANIVAHGLAAVCVWRLACAVDLRPAGGALWAGLVFAAHPVNTEAVAWIAQLASPLYAIGVTCACVAWLRWRRDTGGPVALLAVFGWYAFALLGKEHGVAVPALVLGIEWALRRDDLRPAAQRALAWAGLVVLTGLYVWWRGHVLGRTAQIAYWGGGLWPTALTMLTGFRTYVRLVFLPVRLHPEYIIPIATHVTAPGVIASGLLLAAIVAFAVAARRRAPRIAFGIAWFFLALAPVSNLVPMKTIINERLLYLATIGFGLCLGVAFDRAPRPWIRALLAAHLAVLALLTVRRTADWRTSARLWRSAVAVEPRGYTSRFNLGLVHAQRDELDAALEEFERAIELRGRFPHAYGAMGNVYMRRGEYVKAADAYREGLAEDPGNAGLRHNLAVALVRHGDGARAAGWTDVARAAYREALEVQPQNADARAGLAAVEEPPA